jgi:hypothetical protein
VSAGACFTCLAAAVRLPFLPAAAYVTTAETRAREWARVGAACLNAQPAADMCAAAEAAMVMGVGGGRCRCAEEWLRWRHWIRTGRFTRDAT